MLFSISVTRISLALNLARRPAAMALQATPKRPPSRIMPGSMNGLELALNQIGKRLPPIAPRISCPSAPMFQTRARKPMASACAIRRSGAIFRKTSAVLKVELKGAM